MNASDWNRLVETAWRRPLNDAERRTLEEFLRREPSLREKWEAEAQLSACLDRLPPAPVASNFTARVLQAIVTVEPLPLPWWRRLPLSAVRGWPAVGWTGAAALVLAGGLLYWQQREAARSRLAVSVATMARGVSTPVRATEVPELWLDFDSIRLMSQAQPVADEDLLAALK